MCWGVEVRVAAALLAAGMWAGAASASTLPWASALGETDPRHAAGTPWAVELLPDQRFPPTEFELVDEAGRQVLRIEARGSYGNLVQRLQRRPGRGQLSWRWRVESFNRQADLRRKETDDTSIKVCVLFDMPIERVPFVERQLLRLARASSGQELPAATLCYVWDARLPAGTLVDNPYSRRVRYMVLRSGPPAGGQWLAERRDLGADFRALFGDESPGEVPPLLAIGVGADADNTGGSSVAWIADLRLTP